MALSVVSVNLLANNIGIFMQKRMSLLLFILLSLLSSLSVYAMEEEEHSCCRLSSLRSYLPAWFTKKQVSCSVLSPMQKLQEDKSKFEARLHIVKCSFAELLPRSIENENPNEFFRYCYHQNLHNEFEFGTADVEDLRGSWFEACKKAQINGYSAVGAAIIAKDVFVEYKRSFIQKLMNKGFQLTEEDRKLVVFELYDAIPAEQKKFMISLLQDHKEGNLALLPYDVRKYIVDYIVHLYRDKEWLYSLLQ